MQYAEASSAGIEYSFLSLGIGDFQARAPSSRSSAAPPPPHLLGGIGAVILACVDINHERRSLMAAFVMSSWFVERLTVAPYLALVGPPGSGKTTLLRVLNQVCRRPLLTADITSAAFYEVYEKLSPTLIVDETPQPGMARAFPSLENWNNARISDSPQGPIAQGPRSQRIPDGPSERCGFEQPMHHHPDAGNKSD